MIFLLKLFLLLLRRKKTFLLLYFFTTSVDAQIIIRYLKFHVYTFFNIETTIFSSLKCLHRHSNGLFRWLPNRYPHSDKPRSQHIASRHPPPTQPFIGGACDGGCSRWSCPGTAPPWSNSAPSRRQRCHCRRKRLTAYPLCLTSCQVEAMAFLAIIDVGVGCRDCPLQI